MKLNSRARFLAVLALLSLNSFACRAFDSIILRNGSEYDVRIFQITDNEIVYSVVSDESQPMQSISPSEVYMVSVEKQGNIYITPDGKRITGEPQRADRKRNDIVYLIKGVEIAADNVKVSEESVSCVLRDSSKGFFKKKGKPVEVTIKRDDVFMIRYKSGLRDILNSIEVKKEPVDAVPDTAAEPKYIVVFHSVKKDETLEKVAKEYGVEISQIREWNELPIKIKDRAILKVGMQLMIYQPKK